jgi:S-formylglutathione hydrolase FrmB
MIVVSATTNIDGKDWGCSDAPGGPSVATWLSDDVQSTVRAHFNVDAHSRWNLLGLSAGAACAVRLALTHFDQFAAAASIAGYNAPDAPVLTGDRATISANNLRTLAAAGTPRPVSLLLAASRQDPGTLGDAKALQRSVGTGVQADIEEVAHGGHNWDVWAAMTPPALIWLGQHISP